MKRATYISIVVSLAIWANTAIQATCFAASPSAKQALQLRPVQTGVDYAIPDAAEIEKCTITSEKVGSGSGWVVEGSDGTILRKFVDTNGDNTVDRWSYYKDSLEVYRDIDSDFNGKADQYRWFFTAGTRWGIDKDEDGKIESWKVISAEEVSAEVIAALAAGDAQRFKCLVLHADELALLGLGKEKAAAVAERVAGAETGFKALAAAQKSITAESKWIQFSGTKPGTVPVGVDGSTKDLRVYENTAAIAQTGSQHAEVQLGTLVQVGQTWRMIEAPQIASDGQNTVASSGFFFRPTATSRTGSATGGTADAMQKLLAELERLDKEAAEATTPEQQADYNAQRADLLQQIAKSAVTVEDRAMWVRQAADMVSAAVQSGGFPDGLKHLDSFIEELKADAADKDLVPYVTFRRMTAEYGAALRVPNPPYDKIQTKWLGDLEQFATDFPTAPDAAEAMLQLAIAQEYKGEDAKAGQWYARVAKGFPNSSAAKKAAGAKTRLESVGKVLSFSGKTTQGATVDLQKYRGKVVVIQYWATWSDAAKRDIPALKELATKYSRSMSVIGVNLDSSAQSLAAYLAENRIPWPQVFEEGGMDSRPANELGILSVPTMILIDQKGRVVNRNVQTAELDRELRKLIR